MRKARLQRADRLLDQSRPVVEGDDGHLRYRPVRQRLLRQTGIHLMNLLLHVVDHFQWVRPVAGNHHAAHGLHTFLVQSAAPRARPDVHESDIGNAHRHPLPDGDDGVLDVRHILHVTQPTDQVFHLVHLHRLGADVEVALLHGVHHVHHRHVERVHRVWVQLYLVLLDKPARRCYFGHALGGGQGVLHIKVLYRPQFLGVPASGGSSRFRVAPLQRVPVDLPQRRSVRAQRRLHVLGQRARRQRIQFLQDARTAPVELDIILKDDVDKRHPEHGRATDGFHPRYAQQRGSERVRNLVLDVLGRTSHPFRGHNLLVITDVGDSIHRNRVSRHDAPMPVEGCGRDSPDHDQRQQEHGYYPVFEEITDYFVDHIERYLLYNSKHLECPKGYGNP